MQMDKGIAKKFKDEFGCMDKLRAQKVKTGGVAFIRSGDRFVLYDVYFHI